MIRQQHSQLHFRMPRFRFCYSPSCQKIKASVMSYDEFGHTVLCDMYSTEYLQSSIPAHNKVEPKYPDRDSLHYRTTFRLFQNECLHLCQRMTFNPLCVHNFFQTHIDFAVFFLIRIVFMQLLIISLINILHQTISFDNSLIYSYYEHSNY